MIQDLYKISADTEVSLQVTDGTQIVGRPSRIDRDEAGIRIEVCPYDGDAPQYRVRANRTPTGWRNPCVERRPINGEWNQYGQLAGVEVVYSLRER